MPYYKLRYLFPADQEVETGPVEVTLFTKCKIGSKAEAIAMLTNEQSTVYTSFASVCNDHDISWPSRKGPVSNKRLREITQEAFKSPKVFFEGKELK